jgi:hypothetical protein
VPPCPEDPAVVPPLEVVELVRLELAEETPPSREDPAVVPPTELVDVVVVATVPPQPAPIVPARHAPSEPAPVARRRRASSARRWAISCMVGLGDRSRQKALARSDVSS